MELEIEDNAAGENDTKIESTAQQENTAKENEANGANGDTVQKELATQKDKYLRLFAEFDNYKKRTAKEVYEIRQTAAVNVIGSLLEVLDDIERAEEQNKQSTDNSKVPDGIQLIFNKFKKILEQHGLKAIETLHTEFDVEKDEAVSEIPVPDENMKGKVVAEVQKGYTLNDKLIRFAKVVVGK
ncbi:MAG: nucleotide exchange factor GrpE [Chitinophagaceae bacterium]|nr:nucleotide exchange factor GrpE [Chitinophagaceae bacterium]